MSLKDITDNVNFADPLDLFGSQAQQTALRAGQLSADARGRALSEQERQFQQTLNSLSPFLQGGTSLLGQKSFNFEDILNSGVLDNAIEDQTRDTTSQLGSFGQLRSGFGAEQVADVPTNLALAFEDMLNNRRNSLVGLSQNAAGGLGALGQDNANSISSLIAQQGQALGNAQLASGQASAQGANNALGIAGSLFGFLSDDRLKKNKKVVGKIGKLNIYEWDWIDKVKPIVEKCNLNMTTGFMHSEVKEHYPAFVGEFGGYGTVNYPELLEELNADTR